MIPKGGGTNFRGIVLVTAERVELYAHVLPPGRPIPIKVSPFPVNDTIPGEEDISEAVTWL